MVREADGFSKLRRALWPIHEHELGKFFSISALMFCVLFNQNVLRILKDSLLISEISAEITSFAKAYCVTPLAALFVIIYARMLDKFTYQKIFSILSIFFIVFFLLFGFVILPNINNVHISRQEVEYLANAYPHMKWYILMIGNWGYITFYSLAELWPNIFYVLMFWQLTNQITTKTDAPRFYTLFSLFGNSALIFVGIFISLLTSQPEISNVIKHKEFLIQVAILVVVCFSIISMFIVRYLCKSFFVKNEKPHRPNLGFIDNFKYIVRSRYLWLLLVASSSFGLVMNLIESVWKAKIKELYPTLNAFTEFQGQYIMWTGVFIMIMTIVGNNLMRKRGWFITAILTPVVILVTGSMFFGFTIMERILPIETLTPLLFAVHIGAVQNVIAKGMKYSIWDTSKEMLYIPLDNELKTKGKAAVDVTSAKVGKAFSGILQSVMFSIFPFATYSSISPFLMIAFIVFCLAWIASVNKIYKMYKEF